MRLALLERTRVASALVHATFHKEYPMLRWALTFLIIALVAAVLGFGSLTNLAADIARILFFVFIVLFLISTVAHVVTGKRPPMPPV